MTKVVQGKITSDFYEPRPLSNPGQHVHGAIDIAAPTGTKIVAPEDGILFGIITQRQKAGTVWQDLPVVHNKVFPWCNYFYDVFGGLLILKTYDIHVKVVKTHIFAHSYANQIINNSFKDFNKYWIEEKSNKRFVMNSIFTEQVKVFEGQVIGYVGNAGYSTGPHVHWEVHHGEVLEPYEKRINPEKHIV